MIFVKLTNGNVLITTDGGDTVKLIQDTGVQVEVIGALQDTIQISQFGYPIYVIPAADVSATEVQPAAPIAFAGTASQLVDLLAADFFVIDTSVVIPGTVNVNVVSPNPLPVTGTLTATIQQNLDAFYRLRISNPQTIFDSKQVADNGVLFWDDAEISGGGTSSTHSANRASTTIAVSNLTAGVRVRQTFRRFNYQPGKSQLINTTFVMGTAATGITRRVGLFDANDGLFLQQTSAGVAVVIRSFVTGAAVDTVIPQASWNIDKLNGTGTSGITLDFTKAQIFFFDFEWLGVGTVRFGFFIDGVPYYCHAVHNANSITSVYMSTPNLPLRYEIQNDGTGPAATFEHICSAVMSEGGQEQTGLIRGINRAATPLVTNNDTNIYPLIAMRLRSGYFGSSVKPVDFSVICTSTAAYNWYILLNPTVVGTAFSFTADANSSIERDAARTSTTTLTGGTILRTGSAVQSNAANSGGSIEIRDDFFLGSSIAGVADIIALGIQRVTGTTETFYCGMNYIDQK
jgi:hypothetical protein